MTDNTNKKFKVSRARIIFVYAMCVVGASLLPLENYLENGNVDSATWVISLLSFLVGAAVVTLVLYSVMKSGRFLGYELRSRD